MNGHGTGGIAVRSERRSSISMDRTPGSVGPGAYEAGADLGGRARPGFTGFASSAHRNLNQDKSTKSMTPGPGSYQVRPQDTPIQSVSSNAFRTGVARLAPSAPGSSVFCSSSVVENPAPNAYGSDGFLNRTKLQKKASKERGYLVVGSRSMPSIPRREQSNGYRETKDRKLVQQAPPVPTFTGEGADKIGPGQYDPSFTRLSSTVLTKSVNFHANKAARRVFEPTKTRENDMPDRNNPAPSHYNPVPLCGKMSDDLEGGRSLQVPVRQSAAFKSGVKMAHQLSNSVDKPGPGNYNHAQHISDGVRALNPNVLQGFGSLSQRKGWNFKANQPYTAPLNSDNPGPGTYGEKRSSFAKRQRKKKTLAENEVGFNATGDRPCCTGKVPIARVGPGSHNPETLSSLAYTVSKKLTSKTAAFGSAPNKPRFDVVEDQQDYSSNGASSGGGGSGSAPATDSNPGPGQYEQAHTLAQPYGSASRFVPAHQAGTGAFRSGAPRVARAANGHEKKVNGIYIVGERNGFYNTPPPTTYVLDTDFDKTVARAKVAEKGHKAVGSCFASAGGRPEHWVKADADAQPGPGQYIENVVQKPRRGKRRQHAPPGRFSMATRFEPAQSRSNVLAVGPGSHDIAGSMQTKTYNITMA